MESPFTLKTIAHIRSDFPEKFGIPRQSGLIEELKADILFEPDYRTPDALRGLEEYSHIWLIWGFSESVRDGWSPTVRPPRLGGNQRMGVFATRSPFRPNPLGLSCVRLTGMEHTSDRGVILHITGADLLDGTPIFDIKPYLPAADCHPEALSGFAGPVRDYHLEVVFPQEWLDRVPEATRSALHGVLSQDPRPSYQDDPERVYGLTFAGLEIKFTVSDGVLTVCRVTPANGAPHTGR